MTESAVISAIKAAAAIEYGVSVKDINGPYKTKPVAEARQAAMFACLQECAKQTKSSISRSFKRDPSTVTHALAKVQERINANPDMAVVVQRICAAGQFERKVWGELAK